MKKNYLYYPIIKCYHNLKPEKEFKNFILNSKRLLLFLLIIANTFFTQAQSVQLPAAIPIDSRGVWDRGDQFIADPNNPIYDFVKGIRAEFFWSQIEPSPGVYDWSAIDTEIQTAATHNKLVYINLLVGPDCPAWVYANGVPKVLANTTQFNGEFPYYLDPDYKFYYYRIIAQFGQHIRTLPQNLREKLTFLQVMTGCTGDEVAYKGTLKSGSSSYSITDTDWLNFRIDAFKEYKKAFYDGDVSTRVPMLFNNVTPDEGSFALAWDWVVANIGTGFGIKGSAYARGHHLDSELDFKNTWYDKLVNPQSLALFSRCEMDQSFTKPLYQINVPLGFYWGMLSGLNTGLCVWDLSAGATQAAISDPAIMESIAFFNKYAGQIYPSTATSAYCVFHEGLNSANETKFPSATYGSPVSHGNEARYLAICNATKYSSRGAKMDDSFAATKGQVYQRDSQTGYNDAGWQIEEGNYERWITQIDPEGTSIGLFRVRGTIGASSSKYDRFARSFESSTGKNTMYFQLHNEFQANNKTLKFTVRWLDKNAGSTWAFKYRNASGLQTLNFTGIGGNQWKVETITITDAIMNQGGAIGSDFLLVNTDGNDDVFSSVEMDVIGSTSIKQDQNINFNALPSKTMGDADFNPGATASSGLAVSYTSSNTAVATIINGMIHIVGAGTSTITASQAGDQTYNAALSVSQDLTVSKASQTITFNALPSKTMGDADFNPGATASSGLAVSYVSSNTAVATIVNGSIHIVGAGTATITASQAGNTNYNAATDAMQVLTVSALKLDQTITFAALAAKTVGDADYTAGATASSGLTVSYASSNTAVATIVGGNIHIVGAGTATITASQAGDATYNAATSVPQTLAVNKINQTITFNALSAKVVGDVDYSAGATASSGLTVSYVSSNTAVATIVSGLIHIVGAGTSTITASQAGDTNYNSATNVSQTLTVTTGQVVTTYAPTSFTVLLGTKNSGTVTRLATNDGNVMVFDSSTSSTRSSDWYSSTVISQTPSSVTKLTINYDGKNSISRTQLLYLYNWSTSSWTQIDSRTVYTTDVLVTNIQNSPVNFISPTGEIRLRVYSSGGNKSYTCSADWVSFTVENSNGLRLKPGTTKAVSSDNTNKFKVFPNPAAGSSIFEYSIPEEGTVQLSIYNLNGQMIRTIVNNETHLSGNYTKAFDVSGLGNGVYVAQLKVGNQVQTIKVIVKN